MLNKADIALAKLVAKESAREVLNEQFPLHISACPHGKKIKNWKVAAYAVIATLSLVTGGPPVWEAVTKFLGVNT